MKALFIELPPFERYRQDYLTDDEYRNLQNFLLLTPKAGNVIAGTGGLRKLRFGDPKRAKASETVCELFIIGMK